MGESRDNIDGFARLRQWQIDSWLIWSRPFPKR